MRDGSLTDLRLLHCASAFVTLPRSSSLSMCIRDTVAFSFPVDVSFWARSVARHFLVD